MSRAFLFTTIVLALASCHGTRAPEPPDRPARSQREAVVEMFARSYVPGRSGQIFLVAEKGDFFLARPDDVYRFMHGSPWEYDVEIPILFHGPPFVRPGLYPGPTKQQDVAPTLATLIGLPPPSTMNGSVLSEAISGGSDRPRAILVVVLDGLGSDTFERLLPKLSTLSRLRREGAWFPDAEVNYLPSVTSAGHSTIATGVDPRFHGIHANATF